jgi:DNA-binding IclR family transcriptional regulator
VSLKTRIKSLLSNTPAGLTSREIADGLGANGNTVRRALGELMSAGVVVPNGCSYGERFAPTIYALNTPELPSDAPVASEGADAHQG